ncbi:MAG: glycoside hydrolase [Bacteroidales bacterium]|nr:glycoside hydrolase [Bacteroidales bacterium]
MKRICITIILLLSCILGRAGEVVLSNENARLVFSDGKDFKFTSFTMAGHEILPDGGSTAMPWEITLLGPRGENPLLVPRYSWYDGVTREDNSLVFTWRLFLEGREDWKVRMRVALAPGDEMPQWSFEACMPQGWVVTKADFPRISVRSDNNTKAILPISYGARYDMSGTLRSDYPSCTGTMQMVMLDNPEGTLFFSARDYEASRKSFYLISENGGVTLLQQIFTSYAWTSDGVFRIPWKSVLGFRKDDWQTTASEWYRPFALQCRWGAKSLRDRKIAKWIENADVWIRPCSVSDEEMEAVRQALNYYGKGTGIHWYQWHKYPFDTNYPDYLPAREGFAEKVKEARKLGGFVTPYINGRLWDPANETYIKYGGAHASCRKSDGALYTEVYGSKAVNTVTCPASPIWQEVMRKTCSDIIRDYGTDGVYIDQIGAAIGEPCYSGEHPHAKGAGSWWPMAYRSLLEGMRKDIFTKGKAVTTEENAECYMDLVDMMLIVNSPHNAWTEMVPLFPLIYSDRCIYSGLTYIPDTLNNGILDYLSMKSLLWGSQLGWVAPSQLMKPENAVQAEFMRTLARFRKANHDIFVGGLFKGEVIPGGDNPLKDIPTYQRTPVVMGARWLDVKGKESTIIVNMDSCAHKVSLDGKEIEIEAYSCKRI